MHPYFNDDPVGNLFSTMGKIFASHVAAGRNTGALDLTQALDNALFHGLFGVLYLAAVWLVGLLIKKWAEDVYVWLKQKWTST
jgi:hypothetical protein